DAHYVRAPQCSALGGTKRMSDYEDSMQSPLKLGFFIQPLHPPSRPYGDVLREDREAVVLADRLGLSEAFIGEHLVDRPETITSSLAFIASLADACPSITFGTGVLPLANYHPAMAAAQVAMVDHLVHGRLVLGGGSGGPRACGAIGERRRSRWWTTWWTAGSFWESGPVFPAMRRPSETWARTATARPRRRSSTCA